MPCTAAANCAGIPSARCVTPTGATVGICTMACIDDADCGSGNRCATVGNAHVCARACSTSNPCPTGGACGPSDSANRAAHRIQPCALRRRRVTPTASAARRPDARGARVLRTARAACRRSTARGPRSSPARRRADPTDGPVAIRAIVRWAILRQRRLHPSCAKLRSAALQYDLTVLRRESALRREFDRVLLLSRSRGADGRGCLTNTDCESGECAAGICVSSTCVGSSCDSGSPCCAASPYCTGDRGWTSGRCGATRGANGGWCLGDSDCASGTCSANRCIVVSCSTSTVCNSHDDCCTSAPNCVGTPGSTLHCSATRGSSGTGCADGRDCSTGYCHSGSATNMNKTCRFGGGLEGYYCGVNNDCEFGWDLECYGGRCAGVAVCDPTTPCTIRSQCCTAYSNCTSPDPTMGSHCSATPGLAGYACHSRADCGPSAPNCRGQYLTSSVLTCNVGAGDGVVPLLDGRGLHQSRLRDQRLLPLPIPPGSNKQGDGLRLADFCAREVCSLCTPFVADPRGPDRAFRLSRPRPPTAPRTHSRSASVRRRPGSCRRFSPAPRRTRIRSDAAQHRRTQGRSVDADAVHRDVHRERDRENQLTGRVLRAPQVHSHRLRSHDRERP